MNDMYKPLTNAGCALALLLLAALVILGVFALGGVY
jgi:hypothetical protein